MSRHRNIRSMNVHDEYEGYDDVYGHSVEDDYGVSPATEAQFMYRRSEAPRLSSFIEESKKESIEEEEEYDYDDHEDHDHSLSDSQTFQWPRLSDQNEARLRSCLEEIQNVIGDSVPQHVLVDTVMRCDYDLEKALDAVLSIQDKPKEARPMPTAAAPPRTQEHTSVDLASPSGLLRLGHTTVVEVPTSKSLCSTAMPPSDIPPLRQSTLSNLFPPTSKLPTMGDNLLKNKNTGSSPLMSLSQLAGVHLGSAETAKNMSPVESSGVGHSLGKLNLNVSSSKPLSHKIGSKNVSVDTVGHSQESNSSTMSLSELANLHLSGDEKMSTSPFGSTTGTLGGKIILTQGGSIESSDIPSLGAQSSLGQVHQTSAKTMTDTNTISSLSSLSSFAVSDKDTASDDRSLKIAAHGTSGFSTTDRSQHGISVGKTESSGVLSSSPGLLSTPLSQLSSSPLGLGVGLLSRSTCGSQSNSLPTGASPPHPVSNISHLSGSPQSTLSSLSGVSQLSGSNQARNSSLFGMGQNAGPVKLGGGLSSSQAQSGLPLTMLGSTSSGKLGTVSLSDYQLLGQGFSGGSLDDLGPLGSQTSKTNVVDKKTTSSNEGIGSLNKSGLGSRKDTSIEGNRKGSAALQLPLSSLCSTAGDPSLTSGLLGSTGGMHIDLSAALRKDEPRPLHLSSKTQAKTSSKILPAAQHMSKKVQEFEDRPLSPSFWEQNIFLPKEAISRPSPFAQALCCKECRYIRAGNHPRFTYHHQRKGQRSVSPVQVAQIVPFDFSTPSPDDVVKKKQKAAFTRPNGVG
ncbi:proline and serine-rich protein 1-like isoform X1 [Branchiostoma floridae]|uniref:Proline and serine-rich protein 1-like isoform X1 n=1 Tax=Branchiostoma floridae TaxID=7739 RepID=A0A9J7HVS9_BRAFL|nr:proline and serine-rich protein 1-like isoform X1 [Branchiostoma floridae]